MASEDEELQRLRSEVLASLSTRNKTTNTEKLNIQKIDETDNDNDLEALRQLALKTKRQPTKREGATALVIAAGQGTKTPSQPKKSEARLNKGSNLISIPLEGRENVYEKNLSKETISSVGDSPQKTSAAAKLPKSHKFSRYESDSEFNEEESEEDEDEEEEEEEENELDSISSSSSSSSISSSSSSSSSSKISKKAPQNQDKLGLGDGKPTISIGDPLPPPPPSPISRDKHAKGNTFEDNSQLNVHKNREQPELAKVSTEKKPLISSVTTSSEVNTPLKPDQNMRNTNSLKPHSGKTYHKDKPGEHKSRSTASDKCETDKEPKVLKLTGHHETSSSQAKSENNLKKTNKCHNSSSSESDMEVSRFKQTAAAGSQKKRSPPESSLQRRLEGDRERHPGRSKEYNRQGRSSPYRGRHRQEASRQISDRVNLSSDGSLNRSRHVSSNYRQTKSPIKSVVVHNSLHQVEGEAPRKTSSEKKHRSSRHDKEISGEKNKSRHKESQSEKKELLEHSTTPGEGRTRSPPPIKNSSSPKINVTFGEDVTAPKTGTKRHRSVHHRLGQKLELSSDRDSYHNMKMVINVEDSSCLGERLGRPSPPPSVRSQPVQSRKVIDNTAPAAPLPYKQNKHYMIWTKKNRTLQDSSGTTEHIQDSSKHTNTMKRSRSMIHSTDEQERDLDAKIRKIQEKNAAILERQKQIEYDKKKYGQ